MAQLRDALTSDLLAAGTPTEIALLAERFAATDVLYDDVGEMFDAAIVLRAHRDRVTQLQDLAAAGSADVDQADVDEAREPERAADALHPDAEAAMIAARRRIGK